MTQAKIFFAFIFRQRKSFEFLEKIIFEYLPFGGCNVTGRIFIPGAVAIDAWGVLNNAIILSLLIRPFIFVDVVLSFEDKNAFCNSLSKLVVVVVPSTRFVDDVVNISCKGSILSVKEAFTELVGLFKEAVGNDGSSKNRSLSNFNSNKIS